MTAWKSVHPALFLVSLIALCGLSACSSLYVGSRPPVPPIAGPPCEQPLLELVPEPERNRVQTFGQITMTATPIMPECELWTRVTGGDRMELINLIGPNPTVIEITEKEYLAVGSIFAMEFTITNQDPDRVFRPGGAIWEVLVDDNSLGNDDSGDLSSLLNMALAPGRTRTLSVGRISYPSFADAGTSFTFALYDVVVQQGEAGEVTQRETFRWTYTLRYRTVDQPPYNRAAECRVDVSLASRVPDPLPADIRSADYEALCLGVTMERPSPGVDRGLPPPVRREVPGPGARRRGTRGGRQRRRRQGRRIRQGPGAGGYVQARGHLQDARLPRRDSGRPLGVDPLPGQAVPVLRGAGRWR